MRVFFGLELDSKTAIKVADWRDRQLPLTANPTIGRAVPPANFHITLAFVGELPDTALEQLCLGVDEWLADGTTAGGLVSLNTIGYWPKPGIYWLGPDVWPQHLSGLAAKLRGLATAAGGKRDRNRFQPHITLFRGCSGAPPPPVQLPDFALGYGHVTLFESRQGRRGVSYHPLQDWQLG
jgi:2'-5' RNA ligase